ncbi:hypothetical protein NADE_005962 [Nannochloris sp. 'desiccata']|nr:hypothetical protein NADE_005962 [Chlorella desiccata (nom. nud.)]
MSDTQYQERWYDQLICFEIGTAIILCCLVLVASTMAAGTVVRPSDSTGVKWYPFGLGTDVATTAQKGYKLSGGFLTSFSTAPYPQGCFMACVNSRFNDDTYKKGCESWSYQKSTKKCRFFKNKAYKDLVNTPCVTWEKASSDFVSGWIYSGEDDASDYAVCKK